MGGRVAPGTKGVADAVVKGGLSLLRAVQEARMGYDIKQTNKNFISTLKPCKQ